MFQSLGPDSTVEITEISPCCCFSLYRLFTIKMKLKCAVYKQTRTMLTMFIYRMYAAYGIAYTIITFSMKEGVWYPVSTNRSPTRWFVLASQLHHNGWGPNSKIPKKNDHTIIPNTYYNYLRFLACNDPYVGPTTSFPNYFPTVNSINNSPTLGLSRNIVGNQPCRHFPIVGPTGCADWVIASQLSHIGT